jgi:hypothetical protein
LAGITFYGGYGRQTLRLLSFFMVHKSLPRLFYCDLISIQASTKWVAFKHTPGMQLQVKHLITDGPFLVGVHNHQAYCSRSRLKKKQLCCNRSCTFGWAGEHRRLSDIKCEACIIFNKCKTYSPKKAMQDKRTYSRPK